MKDYILGFDIVMEATNSKVVRILHCLTPSIAEDALWLLQKGYCCKKIALLFNANWTTISSMEIDQRK